MKTAMSRPEARLPLPPIPLRLNHSRVIGKVPGWWPSTTTRPQTEKPMRITYSITPMATWVRAVSRMPATAITSKTTMTAVLMKMFGQVLSALPPTMASTDGASTTTPTTAAIRLAAVAGVVVLAPSVLAIFGGSALSTWPNIFISTAVIVVLLVIAVAGIRLTARTQVAMGVIEYVILIGFSIWGLVFALGHHHGSFPITRDWFNLGGIGGQGSLASGLLIAVFMLAGWDATVYVNEEVKHRRHNPGKAAVIAVALLIAIYTFSQIGLQGVVSPAKLQANSSSVLVYVAQALGGGPAAKVMALALALSVIASTGVSIVILARMIYGMASHRVLPSILGNVSPRFATPAIASVVVGVVLVAVTWIYLLSGSIANAFTQLIDVTGVLYASFYILTAFSAIVYYRRRIFSNAWDAVLVGILPLAAAGFLVWIVIRSWQNAPGSQRWSLFGIVMAGVALMLVARYILRSPFFRIPRESAPR